MSDDRYMKVMLDGEELYLKGDFYKVMAALPDVGETEPREKRLLGLWLETPEGEAYCDLTVSFGEFVGAYGNFFANVNEPLPNTTVEQFLTDNMIAFPAGGFKQSTFVRYPAYRLSPHVMEKLFTEKEIADYKLDFDFYGEATEEQRTSCEWVKGSLANEKKSFDEFLTQLQGRA